MPMIRAIPPGISFNNFFYNFVTRCRLWPSWFGSIFDGLQPRIKFLFPSTNRVIRHISRSVNNSNFSKYLFQATYPKANFYVGPYFLLLDNTLTNHFYCSSQRLRVFKWQIIYLSIRFMGKYLQYCLGIGLRYTGISVKFHLDIKQRHNTQFFWNTLCMLSPHVNGEI